MAVFDLGVLYAAIPSDLVGWNRFGHGNSYSEFTCIISLFALRVSANSSQYILLALTVDRLIAVRFPFKAKHLCTVRRAVWVCFAITVIGAIRTGHLFWTRGNQTVPGPNGTTTTINCGYTSPEAQHFLAEINSWLSLVTACYVPVISSIIMNLFIVHGLWTRDR